MRTKELIGCFLLFAKAKNLKTIAVIAISLVLSFCTLQVFSKWVIVKKYPAPSSGEGASYSSVHGLRAKELRRQLALPGENNEDKLLEINRKFHKQKLILLWTTKYNTTHWITNGHLKKCSRRCLVTTNKDDLDQSDAIMFYDRDIPKLSGFPQRRLAHQRWVYVTRESPPHRKFGQHPGEIDRLFNWTASYRHDSDLVIPYGRTREKQNTASDQEHRQFIETMISPKSKMAMARISHCQEFTNHGLQYVNELRKYVDVDVYGQCGDKVCPKQSQYCDFDLPRTYKFFLAFENSCCLDYITDKFWNSLKIFNSVPVVMGGEGGRGDEYKTRAPPNSYINTAHFSSAKMLADFMENLDKNQTLYESYFNWRRDYEVTLQPGWCRLCDGLYDQQRSLYAKLSMWFEKDACAQGAEEECDAAVTI